MKLLNVDTIESAREKLLAAAGAALPGTEIVDFYDSLGRVLAEDVRAAENIPDFRKSTVDGYAVRSKDTQGVTDSIPVFLDVVETIQMGRAPEKTVGPGQASYVPTGGMLPEGADAVVMVEYCEDFDAGSIAVYDSVSYGRNVIGEGEDVSAGSVLMPKGRVIRPQEIGVLASAGVKQVRVYRPWTITVISTGDELIGMDDELQKAKTRDINTYSVMSSAKKHGFRIVGTHVLKDDRELIKKTIESALQDSDVVAVSGGSSQGEKDHTASVMDEISAGGVFTHGIALKPGKPTILAYDDRSETVMIGLPGHPAAAMLVFELMIIWLYRQLTGQPEPVTTIARVTENVPSAGGRATCLLVSLEQKQDGIYMAEPVLGKSGLMTTLTRADGYTVIGTNDEGLQEGQLVEVTLF